MKKRKVYKTPKVRSEKIKLGVFGAYGGQSGPVQILEPFFSLCCN